MMKDCEHKAFCHWNADIECDKEFLCGACDRQPPDEDKANGKADPVPVKWTTDYDSSVFPECPACGQMPYSTKRCVFCGQRFIQDDATAEYSKPPEEVRLDCIMCGGIGTLVGTRARSNGHFHGHCEKCGCTVME